MWNETPATSPPTQHNGLTIKICNWLSSSKDLLTQKTDVFYGYQHWCHLMEIYIENEFRI